MIRPLPRRELPHSTLLSSRDVLGGKPWIEGTRVGVQQLGALIRERGWSTTSVAAKFDLTADEIDAALEYGDANLDEMAAITVDAAATCERWHKVSYHALKDVAFSVDSRSTR